MMGHLVYIMGIMHFLINFTVPNKALNLLVWSFVNFDWMTWIKIEGYLGWQTYHALWFLNSVVMKIRIYPITPFFFFDFFLIFFLN